MLLYEFFRALMQPARSPIVAKSAPRCQHGVFSSRGERLDIWKTFEENPVVVNDGSHARLLQHDFAEPDAVGIGIGIKIASLAPGKVAAMLVVPAKQRAAKGGQILTSR